MIGHVIRSINGQSGRYSTCCGVGLKGDPIRAIALEKKSYFVYQCPACGKETIIISQQSHE
jgi:predicted RNA-binding Zn-ribbon protein involved in translation (DUF1610 family)